MPERGPNSHWLNSQDQSQIRKSAMGSTDGSGTGFGSGIDRARSQRTAIRGAATELGNISKRGKALQCL